MRIFFIPGLGEEKWIFDKIAPSIEGEKVFINNWELLAEVSEKGLNASVYAAFLIERFQINKQDVVIGHSLGGWVALHVKNLGHCTAIQIASYTDMKKVFKPAHRHLIFWIARRGWGLNNFVLNFLVLVAFRNEASKETFKKIFRKIMSENKVLFAKQLEVAYNPVKPSVAVIPDVRIHAKRDPIVRPPEEPYHHVPGDHFTLYTYPETVYKPINVFLNNLKTQQERQA